MLSFEEYRNLNEAGPVNPAEAPEAGVDATSTQQVPDAPPQDADSSLLVGALQGAGLGLVVSLLGWKALNKVRQTLERSGYGRGYKAFVRFAKNAVGIDPYQDHKFTPEEAKQVLGRLQKVVATDKASLAGKPANQTTDDNALLSGRLAEFSGKLFDLAKAPKRAVSALGRAVTAFSRGGDAEVADKQTVVGALANGAASPEFRQYYSQHVGKPSYPTTIGKGRKKTKIENPGVDVVNYAQGKQAMNKVDFNAVVGFYKTVYGPTIGGTEPSVAPPKTGPLPEPSAAEKDAFAHRMDRTGRALRSNRGGGDMAGSH